jgi:hypothetical protein
MTATDPLPPFSLVGSTRLRSDHLSSLLRFFCPCTPLKSGHALGHESRCTRTPTKLACLADTRQPTTLATHITQGQLLLKSSCSQAAMILLVRVPPPTGPNPSACPYRSRGQAEVNGSPDLQGSRRYRPFPFEGRFYGTRPQGRTEQY